MRTALALAAALVGACSSEPTRATATAPVQTVSAPSANAPNAPPAASAASAAALTCDGGPLDPGPLFCTVRHLAGPDLRGRASASDDEARAATYLADELTKAGLAARTIDFDAGGRKSRNVVATIAATTRAHEGVVVLGAHLDHLGVRPEGTYFGADDNASGCAVVLGVARALAARKGELGRDVVVVFFGAEEIGLLGSRDFVVKPPVPGKVVAMLNVDMVGRPLSDEPGLRVAARLLGIEPEKSVGASITEGHPELTRIVRETAAAEGHRAVLIDDLPAAMRPTVRLMTEGRGDNAPFESTGIPTIFWSSAESSDYHKPTDTLETIRPELLSIRAKTILRATIAVSTLPRP